MDFRLSPEQSDLRELTNKILIERVTNETHKAAAKHDHGLDLDLWRTLADSGIAGINLPESVGGGGLGLIEAAVVLEEVGRATAPVPAFAVLVAGAALGRFNGDAYLADVAAGDRVVTVAIQEAGGSVHEPSASVVNERLTGEKVCVPAGLVAGAFVVTTTDGLYVVDAGADGVSVQREETTSDIAEALVTFSSAAATKLSDLEGQAWLLDVATAMECIVMAGVTQRALALTAEYTKQRIQFDRQIATFQAVSQRAGDSYVNTEAVKLTAWQAVWRLSEGKPAAEQVASAKYWASDGGSQVLYAAQHLHGGVGVDRDYPLHRCFLWGKQLELSLGSAMPSLVRLGRLIADTPLG
ncbi:MAG TPA: acyl-CoA dehydrogenase family protein [Ilumatobacteraceae bacterium]|jgi:alkylation response protein AidB-like acyl-CoA dehydrogenase